MKKLKRSIMLLFSVSVGFICWPWLCSGLKSRSSWWSSDPLQAKKQKKWGLVGEIFIWGLKLGMKYLSTLQNPNGWLGKPAQLWVLELDSFSLYKSWQVSGPLCVSPKQIINKDHAHPEFSLTLLKALSITQLCETLQHPSPKAAQLLL